MMPGKQETQKQMAFGVSPSAIFIGGLSVSDTRSYHQPMNRNTAERIKSVELALLHAKAQLRPNATRISELESQLAKLKKEI
jgi:hypothetical protein